MLPYVQLFKHVFNKVLICVLLLKSTANRMMYSLLVLELSIANKMRLCMSVQ